MRIADVCQARLNDSDCLRRYSGSCHMCWVASLVPPENLFRAIRRIDLLCIKKWGEENRSPQPAPSSPNLIGLARRTRSVATRSGRRWRRHRQPILHYAAIRQRVKFFLQEGAYPAYTLARSLLYYFNQTFLIPPSRGIRLNSEKFCNASPLI